MVIPIEPPPLLPGQTAAQLSRKRTRYLLGMVVCTLLEAIAILLPPSLVRPAVLILALGVLGFALLGMWVTLKWVLVERRERRAGYTTLSASRYRRYWRLDPGTGAVVRRPGDER
jgi:hypothetical protein